MSTFQKNGVNQAIPTFGYSRKPTGSRGPLEDIGASIRFQGNNVAASFWEAAINSIPETPEAKASTSPFKVQRRDRDRRLIAKSYTFKGKTQMVDADLSKISEGLKLLQAHSALQAASIASGELASGFYVMTNADRAKSMIGELTSWKESGKYRGAVRGLPFQIGRHELSDGRTRITASPMGVSKKQTLENYFSVDLNKDQLAEFSSLFQRHEQRQTPIDFAKVQIRQMAHEKALSHIVGSHGVLSHYRSFGNLVTSGYSAPRLKQGGIRGVISKQAEPLIQRSLSQFTKTNGQFSNSAFGQSVYNTFLASAEAAWQKDISKQTGFYLKQGELWILENRVRRQATSEEAAMVAEAKDEFFQERWKRFMNPVLEAFKMKTHWAYKPGEAAGFQRALRGSMVNGRGFDIFKTHFDTLLRQNAFDTVISSRDESTRNQVEFIKSRLGQLDDTEKELIRSGRPMAPKGVSGRKRVKAFDRLNYRINQLAIDSNSGMSQWKVEYSFQEKNVINRGYGVWVHIAPKSMGKMHPGQTGALQFFVPFEDLDGTFMSEEGSLYTGRFTGVKRHVVDNAAQAYSMHEGKKVFWLKDMEMINQELGLMARGRQPLDYSGKIVDSMHVFSASEMISAHFGVRLRRAMRYLETGNAIDATAHMNGALATALGKDDRISIATGMGSIPTQQNFLIRNTVNLTEQGLVNPFNLAATDKTRVDRAAFLKTFMPDVHGGWSHLEHSPDLQNLAKALWGRYKNNIDPETDLWNSVGANSLYKAHIIYQEAQGAKTALGMNLSGVKAEAFFKTLSPDIFHNGMALGNSFARPVQQYNNINTLRAGGSERANTTFMQVEGYEELTGKDSERYMMTGLVTGGIDDETGEVLSAEEMMRVSGAYEQQAMFRPEASAEMGSNAHLGGMKVMSDMIKGTAVEASARTGIMWDDPALQLLLGVDAEKTMGKHEQAFTILRGQTNILMAEAGANATLAAERLNTIFADQGGTFRAGSNNLITSTWQAGKHSLLRDLGEGLQPDIGLIREKFSAIEGLRQELNAQAGRANPILFHGTTKLSANGKTYTMQYAKALSAVRVLVDPSPSYAANPRNQLYHGVPGSEFSVFGKTYTTPELRLSDRIDVGNIGAIDLERILTEGLFMHGRNLGLNFVASQGAQKNAYDLNQFMSAYENMTMGGAHKTQQTYTPSDLAHRLIDKEGDMDKAGYEARYGRGFRALELPQAAITPEGHILDKLYIPDELPSVANGKFSATPAQQSMDRVLRTIESLSIEDPELHAKALENYNYAVGSYVNTIRDEMTGKNGKITNFLKRLQIKGTGVLKAPLQEDLGRTTSKPFSATVSTRFAEAIGATALHHDEELGKDYFYATVHRDPSVITGRMGARIYIDKDLPGLGLHVHESLREALIGDSDGDKVRVLLEGMLHNSSFSENTQRLMDEQAEIQWQEKVKQYARRQAKRKPGTFFENAQDFHSWLTAGITMKSSTASQIAEQQYVQQGQGRIGNLVDPIQERLYRMIDETENPQEIRRLSGLASAAGNIKEEFLKVKSGNKEDGFDPNEFSMLIRGQVPRKVTSQGHLAVTEPHGNGKYDPESLRTFMEKHFVKKDEAGNLIEGDEKSADFRALTDFLVNEQIKAGSKNGGSNKWYEEFTTPVTNDIQDVVGSRAATHESIGLAINRIRELTSGKLNTVMGPMERVAQLWTEQPATRQRRAQPTPVIPTASELPSSQESPPTIFERAASEAVSAPDLPPPPKKRTRRKPVEVEVPIAGPGPTAPGAAQPGIEEIAAAMTEATPASSASEAVNATMRSPGRFGSRAVGESISRPWAIAAGVGGALLGLRALTFQGGGKGFGGGAPENLPQGHRAQKPKVRVMDNSAAGSAQSYNINVEATDAQNRDTNQYGQAIGSAGVSGQLNVSLHDHRKAIAEHAQHKLIESLKGR